MHFILGLHEPFKCLSLKRNCSSIFPHWCRFFSLVPPQIRFVSFRFVSFAKKNEVSRPSTSPARATTAPGRRLRPPALPARTRCVYRQSPTVRLHALARDVAREHGFMGAPSTDSAVLNPVGRSNSLPKSSVRDRLHLLVMRARYGVPGFGTDWVMCGG